MRSVLTWLLCASIVSAQAPPPTKLAAISQIKKEAFDNSQVMNTLFYLTDVYGPRLTASPEFNQAADWAIEKLKSYGLENVHDEPWGPFGRGWSVQSYNLEMLTPRYSHLVAAPLAWSSPTNGPVTGDLIEAPAPTGEYDPDKLEKAINEFEAKWRGKLKGKVVLMTKAPTPTPRTRPNLHRYTDAELAEIAKAPDPTAKDIVDVAKLEIPDEPAARREYFSRIPQSVLDGLYKKLREQRARLSTFLSSEQVIAVLRTDSRAFDGLDFAEAAGSEKAATPMAPPTFILPVEQYTRLTRLLEKKVPLSVRADLKVKATEKDEMARNLIGEIRGSSKPNEVVMIGAHFDSWHTGTGATDNAAGSAVMMEVMRILETLKLPLKRTVRIALWSGEEQGLLGSKEYVKRHFADPKTMQVSNEHGNLDVYLNLDNGSGKIRGVYLQGNDAARPIFEQALSPFRDMGVTTYTLKNTGGTDHLSFDAVGLPGFQFIQDPLDYSTVTHHSNMDTYTHLIPQDLMQASAIIASLVYDFANSDAKFPRKALPQADTAQQTSTN